MHGIDGRSSRGSCRCLSRSRPRRFLPLPCWRCWPPCCWPPPLLLLAAALLLARLAVAVAAGLLGRRGVVLRRRRLVRAAGGRRPAPGRRPAAPCASGRRARRRLRRRACAVRRRRLAGEACRPGRRRSSGAFAAAGDFRGGRLRESAVAASGSGGLRSGCGRRSLVDYGHLVCGFFSAHWLPGPLASPPGRAWRSGAGDVRRVRVDRAMEDGARADSVAKYVIPRKRFLVTCSAMRPSERTAAAPGRDALLIGRGAEDCSSAPRRSGLGRRAVLLDRGAGSCRAPRSRQSSSPMFSTTGTPFSFARVTMYFWMRRICAKCSR